MEVSQVNVDLPPGVLHPVGQSDEGGVQGDVQLDPVG